ncbi:hypothetical protein PN836_011285 [Ningiella sp. W23]|uniref:hypothetical protein n=1 Tax=Ningiella sp. W23 TaxID=3023715 RepID=UPI003756C0B5
MSTFKKLLAGAAICLAASTSASASVILSLSAQNDTLNVGEDLVLDITASTTAGSAFTSFGLDLLLDGTQLFAPDFALTLGGDFTPSGPGLDGDGLAGNVAVPFPPLPVPFALSGIDILLASITISDLGLGDFTLSLASTMTDPTEGIFNADIFSGPPGFVEMDLSNASVIVSVSEVSAPASIGILSSMIAGLLLLRRRFGH